MATSSSSNRAPTNSGLQRGDDFAQAVRLAQSGSFDESERLLRRAIKKDRRHADAYALLGMIRLQRGKNREALAPLTQAIRFDPTNASTHGNLAIAYEALERTDKAEAAYRKAIEIDSEFAEAHANLGALLWSRGDSADALGHLEKAVTLNPSFAEAHAARSIALLGEKRSEEALASAAQALAIKPNLAKAWWAQGSCFQALGNIPEALASYRNALSQDPLLAEAYKSLAYAQTQGLDAHLIAQLSDLLVRGDISNRNRRFLHFAMGKTSDDAGDYDAAMKHWKAGAALHREIQTWSAKTARIEYDCITRAFTTPSPMEVSARAENLPSPIFIVGMPRSGTTLVEQTLAGHPDVFAAGESLAFDKVIDDFARWSESKSSYPQGIADCGRENLEGAARIYFDALGADPSASHTVDKNLENYKHLGLIAQIFPNARIVHCRRHPLDTIVSCFSQDFTQGMEWSHDLSDAADYYDRYLAYFDHWHKALPIKMLELDYEDVVADIETHVRKLLKYCGLTWHEDCVSFHNTRRAVFTASAAQVRQPLFSSSIGRWRRYEAHLGDIAARFDSSL